MTREESLKFFSIDDEEDLQDAFEEQLFEQKKFFLSKAPISKLYESRISRLLKIHDAYVSLNGEKITPEAASRDFKFGSIDIHETFLHFQKEKNELKRLISNGNSAREIAELAQILVKLEKSNAQVWHIELEDENDIIVSKEPDPMYVLDAIQSYRSTGGETFWQLKNLENNPPELLIQEMKRLSLLFKKY